MLKGELNRSCRFASTCFIWKLDVLNITIYTKETLFCFTFELIRVQPCWFAFYQKVPVKRSKRVARDTFPLTLLPLMLVLKFMTSLTQTFELKWQHSQSYFCDIQTLIFNLKKKYKKQKTAVFTFNSNPVDRACVSIRSGLPLNHVFHNNIIKIQMGSTVVQMPNHASSAPVYCVSSLVYCGQYMDQICLYTPHIDKS